MALMLKFQISNLSTEPSMLYLYTYIPACDLSYDAFQPPLFSLYPVICMHQFLFLDSIHIRFNVYLYTTYLYSHSALPMNM